MLRAFVVFVSTLLLAGSASALNITIGTTNFTASQLLEVPAGPFLDQCSQSCSAVNTTIQKCGDTDDQCLCTTDVAEGLVACEQCMFNFLVAVNERAPDVRVGSNPSLAAFSTACNASVQQIFPKAILAVAPGWDGPIDYTFNIGDKVVIVGIGAILAFSALFMFSNV